ncbi:PAS domain-containing protein [Caminibacter pacificus]|uniref:Aerotaxis receptor n=1 Tax=Caminibacter pacificus TaxID=1424653 RepID=A0AAJ4RCA8_9BACT|nr:PAS domain-containing protein [Caminibacter pacificus]NPA87915.1 PAS domain-containing protein [Campylobacterota bacterium]QCI27976.1 PAS domain S-box protein [Caminibacter pacificus]ROR39838.1 aerotaxis receptor [Caminibacter pacificus]
MAATPKVTPIWKEATFQSEGLDARALITRTDLKGIITFASLAYRKMTKFDKNELIGSPHSIVRHPFMPEAAFKDMWDTIERGEHWSGMVMNLRKDGKHYWVDVHVDPIDENGNVVNDPSKIAGYVAVRREPTRKEVQEAYKLYKGMRKAELLAKNTLKSWEVDLLDILDKLPDSADAFL